MFLSELRQVLVRRWYLVIVGIVATFGLALAALGAVSPTYTATAEALMLPPATSVPSGSNPYLALGGLDAAGDVLAKSLSSEVTAAEIKASGAKGEYTLALDPDTPAPLVLLTVKASDAGEAIATMNLVLDRLPVALATIQEAANVPRPAFISSTLVTKSELPSRSSTPQLRALVVAVAGGLAVSLLLVAAIDAALRRPSNRGARREPTALDGNLTRSARRAQEKRTRRRPEADDETDETLQPPVPARLAAVEETNTREGPAAESTNGDARLHPTRR